jgi:hypothetical protein
MNTSKDRLYYRTGAQFILPVLLFCIMGDVDSSLCWSSGLQIVTFLVVY